MSFGNNHALTGCGSIIEDSCEQLHIKTADLFAASNGMELAS